MSSTSKNLNFFTQYLRPYKKPIALVLFVMVLESLISLTIPFFIGQFASSILNESLTLGFLDIEFNLHYGYFIAAWVGLIVLQTMLRYQSSFRVNMLGARILTNLSCRLYDHVQILPIDYFSQRKKGEILSLISNDANVLAFFMSGILTGLVPSLLVASGAILLMATINLQLTIIISISVPAFFILLKFLGRKIKPLSEQVTQQQAGIVSIAAENFSSIKLVKTFSREQLESDKFKQNAQNMLNLRRQQFQIQALISPVIQMLISLGIVLVVLVSAISYQQGELNISALITLLIYGLLFAKPMSSLAGIYGQYQQAMGASKRIVDVFNVAPEAQDTGSDVLEITQGTVDLSSIEFAYPNSQPIMSNLNACFKGKSVNVIVGKNGAGKTTILQLLMRFISPQKGSIFIDGKNIEECDLRSLRRHIGLVSQDVALSHGSIIENIAYGQSDATLEQVMAAAKKANAHEFISKLKDGYYTQVGDNGVMLSGGQRQRISLARTLLLECKIIIFDEPTSFADSHGKQEFANLLRHQLNHHTIIVVTHDKELSDIGDKVFELREGRLHSYKRDAT